MGDASLPGFGLDAGMRYPSLLLGYLLRAMFVQTLPRDHGTFFRELAEGVLDRLPTDPGPYDIETVLQRLWDQLHDSGGVRVAWQSPSELEVVVDAWPGEHEWVGRLWLAMVEIVAASVVGPGTTVRHHECSARPSLGGCVHRIRVRPAPPTAQPMQP